MTGPGQRSYSDAVAQKPLVLRPKEHFHTHEEVRRELNTIVHSENFQLILSAALSEFIMRYSANAEQLDAVRQFITVLLNLPLQDEPLPAFPVRTLNHGALAPHRKE